jgi:hypothetical protein
MCDMCDGKTREQTRRELLARIARHDFTMVNVREEWANDRSWVAPGFVYSIGLWGFRQVPELIVVGAPARHAVQCIEKYANLAKAGKRFEPGGPHRDFVPGHGVMLELVARPLYRDWFARSFDFYPNGDFPAYQLLWPDRQGTWPWDADWDTRTIPQPVLTASGRPESWPLHAAH